MVLLMSFLSYFPCVYFALASALLTASYFQHVFTCQPYLALPFFLPAAPIGLWWRCGYKHVLEGLSGRQGDSTNQTLKPGERIHLHFAHFVMFNGEAATIEKCWKWCETARYIFAQMAPLPKNGCGICYSLESLSQALLETSKDTVWLYTNGRHS